MRKRITPLHERLARDDGMTLIELTVGMVLMSIFMVMFTGAILMMNKAMNTSQAINDAASQVNTAFLRLDEAARSASYISAPAKVNGSWYVEMRSLDSAGVQLCTQLRVSTAAQQLQSRTWTVLKPTPTNWLPIASGITNGTVVDGATNQPFVRVLGKGANLLQQLTVTLVPTAGPGISSTSAASIFTVTALNAPVNGATSGICQQARP